MKTKVCKVFLMFVLVMGFGLCLLNSEGQVNTNCTCLSVQFDTEGYQAWLNPNLFAVPWEQRNQSDEWKLEHKLFQLEVGSEYALCLYVENEIEQNQFVIALFFKGNFQTIENCNPSTLDLQGTGFAEVQGKGGRKVITALNPYKPDLGHFCIFGLVGSSACGFPEDMCDRTSCMVAQHNFRGVRVNAGAIATCEFSSNRIGPSPNTLKIYRVPLPHYVLQGMKDIKGTYKEMPELTFGIRPTPSVNGNKRVQSKLELNDKENKFEIVVIAPDKLEKNSVAAFVVEHTDSKGTAIGGLMFAVYHN